MLQSTPPPPEHRLDQGTGIHERRQVAEDIHEDEVCERPGLLPGLVDVRGGADQAPVDGQVGNHVGL